MLKKLLLTVPVLLAGPTLVLVIFVLGYDWSVTGAILTALIASGSGIASLWRGQKEPKSKTVKIASSMISLFAVIAFSTATLVYPTKNSQIIANAASNYFKNRNNCYIDKDKDFGLDASFIAPNEEDFETFLGKLGQSIEFLSQYEKDVINEAISFLTFVTFNQENNKDNFNKKSESDFVSEIFTKLYIFARDEGDCMTLRRYVELSENIKKKHPEFLAKYNSF